jgi:hypothetical protein
MKDSGMPITAYWDDASQDTLVLDFARHWTLDDYFEAQRMIKAELQTAREVTHLVYDFTRTLMPPLVLLKGARRVELGLPPRHGLIVLVNARGFERTLTNIAGHLMPHFTRSVRAASSLTEARFLILHETMLQS